MQVVIEGRTVHRTFFDGRDPEVEVALSPKELAIAAAVAEGAQEASATEMAIGFGLMHPSAVVWIDTTADDAVVEDRVRESLARHGVNVDYVYEEDSHWEGECRLIVNWQSWSENGRERELLGPLDQA